MLWELPGPHRFVTNILHSLERHQHALVVLPRWFGSAGLPWEIGRKVRGLDLGELTVLRIESCTQDPLDAILAQLHSRAVTVEELVDDPKRPSRFLLIDAINDGDVAGWHALLRRAASHTQVFGFARMQLIVLASAWTEGLVEDVFLSVHCWWGQLGQLDVDWMTERRLAEVPPSSLAGKYWTRALCRGLAVCDPLLAARLVEASPRTLEDLKETVASVGPVAPSLPTVDEFRADRARLRAAQPPSAGVSQNLWLSGLLDWAEEFGPVVLTRAVVARGDDTELRRRFWRGQLEVLMPAVERARLEVCEFLEGAHGATWARDLGARASLPDRGDVVEINWLARLADLLRQHACALPSHVRDVIYPWREIRNCLAHLEVVPFEVLEQATTALAGLRTATSAD